jgi:cytochrome c
MTRVILFSLLIIFQEAHSGRSQETGKHEGSAKSKDLAAQCTGCHNVDNDEKKVGPSLKGLFKRQKLLNGSPATEANIRLVIKRGRGGMPAYENILSTDQLDLLVAFLKRH